MSTRSTIARTTASTAALTLGLLLAGCSGGGGGPAPLGSVAGGGTATPRNWYIDSARLTFSSDAPNLDVAGGQESGTYHIDEFVAGEYRLTEAGTYTYDHALKRLQGAATEDLMGDQGLSEGVGASFSVGVPTLDTSTLVLSFEEEGDDTVRLSSVPPALAPPPLADTFDDGVLNHSLWSYDGDVLEAHGKLWLAGPDGEANLERIGLNVIEAEITLEDGQGQGGCYLEFAPWRGDSWVSTGIQRESNGSIGTMVYVNLDGAHEHFEYTKATDYGESHDFRLEWDGSDVDFYIDGDLVYTYTAPDDPGNNIYTSEISIGSWGDVEGSFDDFRASE